MNKQFGTVMALFVGAVTGATLGVAWAQSKAPAYYVAQLDVMSDPQTLSKEYGSKAAGTLEPFGGRSSCEA